MRRTVMGRLYDVTTASLPARLAGSLDLFRPGALASWGGPLNGQRERQRIVRDVARAIDIVQVVETGTFRGTTTEFLAHVTGAPVRTVEGDPRNVAFTRRRISGLPDIELVYGDSREFLRRLARTADEGCTFFYLDAHWLDDLPLWEELEIIESSWIRPLVMVDDFAVPGDPGYGYDDYGPGRKLTAACLPPLDGWTSFYPAASSAEETGARRGCVVLVPPPLLPAVARLPSLRAVAR